MIPADPAPLLLLTLTVSSVLAAFFLLGLLKKLLRSVGRERLGRVRRPPAPPGIHGIPLVGRPSLSYQPTAAARGSTSSYGPAASGTGTASRQASSGRPRSLSQQPAPPRQVLGGDSVGFSKMYMRSISELLGKQSLLCASPENHRRLRRRMSTLFNTQSLEASVRTFDGLTVEALGKWKQGQTMVVLEEALKITFAAICKLLTSIEREDELAEMQRDISEVTEAMLSIPLKLPGCRFFKGLKARRRVMTSLRKTIRQRREGSEHHDDFLQSLLAMDDQRSSDDQLTDSQILDNMLTLIIAGQITTASAIAWMVKYLDENPNVQERVRELHLPLLVGNAPGENNLDPEALGRMAYASMVVKETLRMASIVSWFPRVALEDCEVEGFQIAKGWIVNVDARHIHSDSAVYDNPGKFFPLRFHKDPKPYSFLAFGTGERTCLGMNLAKAMMLVFLHRLVTMFSNSGRVHLHRHRLAV
ncbi:unnamed protein product [Spirodela intermedia]|uniref:Uncharacterized protein n=1 Tax=Spirodela intermedia TaxID=51605 RepID=A0A7I8J5E0_SPIIN|nr:unnamed protein product [Spirodela intermedia]CAA6665250.1 unnamed protein product [Spirodela intermedia]